MSGCLTCAGLPDAAQASADRAQRASSSGPAQSPAGPAVPARNTGLSGCIPQASGHTVIERETCRPGKWQRSNTALFHVEIPLE